MKTTVRNNKGQFVIEAVLMMIVTIGFFLWGTNQLREKKILAQLVEGPWSRVAGMLEAGVWENPESARKQHPNQYRRSLTYRPEN